MSTDDETTMIRETVAKFVDRELIPLEPDYLRSRLPGSDQPELSAAQRERLRTVSKDLGLWGLDAPEDLGGDDLPTRTMAAVNEELGRTCVPFRSAAGLAQPAHAAGRRDRGAEAKIPAALHRGADGLRDGDLRTGSRRRSGAA